jgi:hypothetical protein
MTDQVETMVKRKRGRPFTGGRDPQLGARLPADIHNAVKIEAARRGATPSAVIRDALTSYVQNLGYETEAQAA